MTLIIIINLCFDFSTFSPCNHEIHKYFVKDLEKRGNLISESILEGINIENVNFGIGFI